ncbi:hypothetical protein ILUMI_04773 [Ignelater luminosus]|uniref:Uncharacterized protein n=1 Tax=Ignelater luminosus TaxID=2038154 RepID=A0A8K0GJ98_IGNLU|nr:hypothetical protein ILUMI_04773 [Ignelater luminosus]
MKNYEREISALEALYKEVPTSDVSDESDSEYDAQDISFVWCTSPEKCRDASVTSVNHISNGRNWINLLLPNTEQVRHKSNFHGECKNILHVACGNNAGLQPEGPFRLDNSAAAIIGRMTNHISESGRNETINRWFTSMESVNHTTQVNRRALPKELTNTTDRPVKSSCFAYHTDITITSRVPIKLKKLC